VRYHLTVASRNLPVEDYLKPQGRFQNLTAEVIAEIQQEVDRNRAKLNRQAAGRS
jgi:hypothetical protein